LTNGQAVVSAADVNSKIDLNLPQGYEYISGKLATDEVVKSQTPTAITVIVQSKTPQQQNFSQNIVYKTGDGIIIKNVTGAMTGKLVNGTATVYASDVNAKIDSNMPQGYEYISGKLTTDELIANATPADVVVIVKANSNSNNSGNSSDNNSNNNQNNNSGSNSNDNQNSNNGNTDQKQHYYQTGYHPVANYYRPAQGSAAAYVNNLAQHVNKQQQTLPQTGMNEDDQVLTMALGLGALILSGGLEEFNRRRRKN
jgi:hypothetical protein